MNASDSESNSLSNDVRRRVLRSALLLAGIAFSFYIGFIAIGVMRSLGQ